MGEINSATQQSTFSVIGGPTVEQLALSAELVLTLPAVLPAALAAINAPVFGSSADHTFDWRTLIIGKDPSYAGVNGGAVNPKLGNWRLSTSTSSFAGEIYPDPVMFFGYNCRSGNVDVAGESSIAVAWEADFLNPNINCQTSEWYVEHHSRPAGTNIIRPIFFTILNDESNVAARGLLNSMQIGVAGIDGANGCTFVTHQAGNQVVKELAKLTRNSFSLNFFSGTPGAMTSVQAFQINPQGNTCFINVGTTALSSLRLFSAPAGSTANPACALILGESAANVSALGNGQILGVDCVNAANSVLGIVARAKPTQTASLVEFQTSAGVAKWAWNKVGDAVLTSYQTAATDAAAAALTPAVVVGGTYVNSATGALQVRLT